MFECQLCAVCPHPVTKPLFPSLTSCCARNSLGRQTETRQGIQLINYFALEKALWIFLCVIDFITAELHTFGYTMFGKFGLVKYSDLIRYFAFQD